MRDIKENLLQIRPRSWFLWLMIVTYMGSFIRLQTSMSIITFILCPLGLVVFVCGIVRRKIHWNRYSILILLMAVLFFLSNLRSGVWNRRSVSTLTICCFSMLLLGIVPVDMDVNCLRRESKVMCYILIACLVSIIGIALTTVFLADYFVLFGKTIHIGIETPGLISSRLYAHAHPNTVANYAMLAIAAAVYLLYNRPPVALRVLLALSIVVFLMGIAHCQSRSVNIALGAGAGAMVFRLILQRGRGGKGSVVLGVIAWLATAYIAMIVINGIFTLDVRIAMRLHPSLTEGSAISRTVADGEFAVTSNGRDIVWKGGLNYLIHHPLDLIFGMGAGNIMETISAYNPGMSVYAHLHNSFLQTLARGGIPMLACVLVMLILLVKPTWRALTAPTDPADRGIHVFAVVILMALLHSLTEEFLFSEYSLCNILFFYSAGRVMCAAGTDGGRNAANLRKIPKKASADG